MSNVSTGIVADRLAGMPIKTLCAKYNVGQSTVYRILRNERVDIGDLAIKNNADRRRGKPNATLAARSRGLTAKPSECEWAYIAGIFDGEGSLTREPNGNPRVSIVQNPESGLLEWLQQTVGSGSITSVSKRRAKVFRLCSIRSTFEFLLGVAPFVIVKRDKVHAEIDRMQRHYGWEKT